jgi:competence protein ComEA
MTTRNALIVAALVLAAIALLHPVPRPAIQATSAPPDVAAPDRHGKPRRPAGFDVPADAMVYVAGAVRHPGLYRVRSDERAADVIAQAGGASALAEAGAVNLAARVKDGDEVYVPAEGEAVSSRSTAGGRFAHARSRSRRSRGSAGPAPAAASVDINAADAETLQSVPGLGPTIASRIVALRELDGPFTNVDELLDVAGMTQTRLDRARPFLRAP